MLIGVPKEIKNLEYRFGLTPASVQELKAHNHEVIVESLAGAGVGAGDDDYRAAGAEVVDSAEEVSARAWQSVGLIRLKRKFAGANQMRLSDEENSGPI